MWSIVILAKLIAVLRANRHEVSSAFFEFADGSSLVHQEPWGRVLRR